MPINPPRKPPTRQEQARKVATDRRVMAFAILTILYLVVLALSGVLTAPVVAAYFAGAVFLRVAELYR